MQKEKLFFFFFITEQMEQRVPKTNLIGRVVTFEDEVNGSIFDEVKDSANRAKCKINFSLFSFPRCSLSSTGGQRCEKESDMQIKLLIFYAAMKYLRHSMSKIVQNYD